MPSRTCGRSRPECMQTAEQVAIEAGLAKRVMLWSLTEYKKQRIALFSDQEKAWEDSYAGPQQTCDV